MLPQYDAVIAFTSGTRDMGSVMNLAWEMLLPAFKPAALPADPAAHKKLTAKLASLTLRPQTMTGTSAVSTTVAKAAATAGTRYVFATNPQSIESIALDAAEAERPRHADDARGGRGSEDRGVTGCVDEADRHAARRPRRHRHERRVVGRRHLQAVDRALPDAVHGPATRCASPPINSPSTSNPTSAHPPTARLN